MDYPLKQTFINKFEKNRDVYPERHYLCKLMAQ